MAHTYESQASIVRELGVFPHQETGSSGDLLVAHEIRPQDVGPRHIGVSAMSYAVYHDLLLPKGPDAKYTFLGQPMQLVEEEDGPETIEGFAGEDIQRRLTDEVVTPGRHYLSLEVSDTSAPTQTGNPPVAAYLRMLRSGEIVDLHIRPGSPERTLKAAAAVVFYAARDAQSGVIVASHRIARQDEQNRALLRTLQFGRSGSDTAWGAGRETLMGRILDEKGEFVEDLLKHFADLNEGKTAA